MARATCLFLLMGQAALASSFTVLASPSHAQTTATRSAVPVTFNRNIAPIVFEHCVACHRPGESGRFSLITYDEVRLHATQIAQVTKSRYMPPWKPERGDA